MTGLFYFKRDHHRRKFLPLVGIGLLVVAGISFTALRQAASLRPTNYSSPAASSLTPRPISQIDDLLRDRRSTWPPMSTAQIEQARVTLIREGFSPMQADTILPPVVHP